MNSRAAAVRLRGVVGVLAAAATLVACVETRPRTAAPSAPPSGREAWRRFAPACRLDGCCAGHGEVAYLQPDKFVMCADGETSQICDCH